MKDYKIGLIIFLILATIITLFPPYELKSQLLILNSFLVSYTDRPKYQEVVIGKEYYFLFGKENYDASDRNNKIYRDLLLKELVIEYLLASFTALFIQIIITFAKKKPLNKKFTS